MSASISLTYPAAFHPGVARSDSPGWITAPEIFRRALQLVHSRSFQIGAEAVALLSLFTAVAVWAFALTPGLSSL